MIWKTFNILVFFLWMLSSVSGLTREIVTNMPCFDYQFRCDNGKCIKLNYRCDGDKDCDGDTSDERQCYSPLIRFNRFERYQLARKKAAAWIIGQTGLKPDQRSWGYSPVRAAVALYSHNETYFYHGNITGNTITSELQIYILTKLAHLPADEIDLTELASFVNALLVTCIEPREFYGLDLVATLRARVDREREVHPLPLLALCNAKVPLTSTDVDKLYKIFHSNSRALWTDMQAMAVMGISCAARQPDDAFPNKSELHQFSRKLKEALNSTIGLVDNMKTTGLVLQALITTGDTDDTPPFDTGSLFFNLTKTQKEDGSFGDFWKTYYLLPIFSWKSLINISDDHCTEQTRKARKIEEAWTGEKRQVQYSLWMGTSKYMNVTLKLHAPVNEKFYSIMKVAPRVDERFRFEVSMRNGKPYVYSISGIEDDPEAGNLWYLYKLKDASTTELINMSPIDYMPENGDHLAYWFREVPSYS